MKGLLLLLFKGKTLTKLRNVFFSNDQVNQKIGQNSKAEMYITEVPVESFKKQEIVIYFMLCLLVKQNQCQLHAVKMSHIRIVFAQQHCK